MKTHLILSTLLAASFSAVAAPQTVSWSDGLAKAANFRANTSGKMTITDDETDHSVRFDVTFTSGDFWAYPELTLAGETLADVGQIRFEIKAEQGNPDAKYRFAYVMFDGQKKYFTMPTPTKEYQTVTINVADAVENPAAVKKIRIGMNPRDAKLTYHIRNLEFLTKEAETVDGNVLPWSAGMNKAARFGVNTSGKMTITDDADESAVRFDVAFTAGDFWAYPILRFKGEESLTGVDFIQFDIRAEQGKPDAKFRAAYVMIGEEKPFFVLPTPKAEYQTVTINVAKSVKDPASVKYLRIGMNPSDAKLTFFVRNLKFLSK